MSNEELISEISELLKAQDSRVADLLKAQDLKVDEKLEALEPKLTDILDAQTLKIALLIENTVTMRLDALFDGYKLTHEIQSALMHRVSSLEERVERLEIIAS